MSATAWGERVRALLQDALEQPEEDRAAFLSRACQGDEAIRREVESLVEAHAAAGGFLETPAFRVATEVPVAPALQPGDRVGSFEVVGILGRGGMGEVYRARDAKLDRDVAIKVLPRALATDPQRLARFERESRILASFNHRDIAAIHSVEQIDGVRFLILELVEGPTLGDRMRAGPLPPEEALVIAIALAGALEAAHGRGIVHRDLKPANIKLTASSGIKLLDFGLAKELVEHDGARPGTRAPEGTIDGMIFGTCAYMSPEQARGKPVDKRTDIWAFGCVLFEMLAGRRAFRGETPSDTIAAVLEREPDWSWLPAATPLRVRRVLQRCLEKDPNRRLHDIADARIELEDATPNPEVTPPSRRPRAVRTLAAGLALCAAGLVIGWRYGVEVRDQPASRTTRFTWALPDGLGLDSPPTVSPDGRLIAFTARPVAGGATRLYVRSLNQLEARQLAGTDGAKQPFWSPDARSLGYFARGKLMKVALDGGAPVELCDAPDGRGGAWSAPGVIVFGARQIESGLMRISQAGGEMEPATLLDVQQGENSHRWPVFLPDGRHFLYFVRALSAERRGVYLGRTDRPASTPGTPLLRSESEAVYASFDDRERGVLLTVSDGRIQARGFDARRRLLTGDPRTMDLPAAGNTPHHAMMLTVSTDVLAHGGSFVPFGARRAWIGLDGTGPTLGSERVLQGKPRVSPDGRRLARIELDAMPGSPDLWVEDLARGTRVRVSTTSIADLPVWSPDGESLAYVAGSLQKGVITIAAADGRGVTSTVACPGQRCDPTDWSQDGRWLLATVYEQRDQDVWMLPARGHETARPLLDQPFREREARLSPDGRLVAYVSEESGRPEVSVQTIGGPPRREVISVGGGDQPVWSRDGRACTSSTRRACCAARPSRWASTAGPSSAPPCC
jgi:eukaryotic-like serine/threonine-protein kinase